MTIKGFKDFNATVIVDLTKSIEELENNLHSDAKRYLKKANSNNLVFEESNDWYAFYPIYKRVALNGSIIPIPLETLIHDSKSNKIKLLLIKHIGIVVGGLVMNFENNVPGMLINAINSKFNSLYVGYFAYWNMILWAKKEGYEKLSFGGYQLNARGKLDSINKFKEKWGGVIVKTDIYSFNLPYIIARKLIRNFPIIKTLNDKLKMTKYYVSRRVSKYGFLPFLLKFFNKFIFDKKDVVLFSEDLVSGEVLQPKVTVEFKKLDYEDYPKLFAFKDFIFEEIFLDRLNEGDECYLFLVNGKLAHYSWITYKEMNITEANTKQVLNEGEFCIYDCNTPEEFRGLNLYPAMLSRLKDNLCDKGFIRAYIYAENSNIPSIKGIEKAGFKVLKHFKYINILGFKIHKH